MGGAAPLRTASERLAAWACGLDLAGTPPQALEALKAAILQDLVMGLIARDDWQVESALAFVRGDAGAPGPCTVIGHAERVRAIDAAYVNAVMLRALRQEDTLMPSGIHAVAIALPAALAVGEQLHRSGGEVAAALVAGCEVAAALDRAAPERRARRTASHVYGAFAAGVTAARLLRLDEDQTATAVAYAGNLGAMIQAGFEDHQYGLLARNGLTAAYLGQAGAPAPRDAIEGTPGFFDAQLGVVPGGLDAALDGLGHDYALRDLVLKPFPGALNGGVAALILQRIVRDAGVTPDQVSRVVVGRPPESNDALKHAVGPFRDAAYAASSLPFALAAVLVDGALTPQRLAACNEPELLRLCRLADFEDVEGSHSGYHRVTVHTRSGGIHVGEGDYRLLARPDPAALVRLHGRGPGPETIAALSDAVERLEQLDDIGELTRLLAPPDASAGSRSPNRRSSTKQFARGAPPA